MRIEPPLEIPGRRKKRAPAFLFYLCSGLLLLLFFLLWKDRPASKPLEPLKMPSDNSFHADLRSLLIYKTKRSRAVLKDGEFFYGLPDPESVAGLSVPFEKGLEVSGFKILRLKIRTLKNQALPDNLRLELKSSRQTLRALPAKLSGASSSQTLQFPLRFKSATALKEIAILISYAKAGEAKSGGFQITDLSFS